MTHEPLPPLPPIQVRIGFGDPGTVIYDGDVSTMTDGEFEAFWFNAGNCIRSLSRLMKAANKRRARGIQ